MSSQLAAVAFQPLDLDAVAELLYGPPYYRPLLRTARWIPTWSR